MTSILDLQDWFEEGKRQKNVTHMVVCWDHYDHEDYPVYVFQGQDVHKVVAAYNGPNMQSVMEVYSYKKSFEKQKTNDRGRCWDYE